MPTPTARPPSWNLWPKTAAKPSTAASTQSDTFSKAETWAAGKDRNERDDTIYSGERGIFRGFIAAQEGWLTDGESGVTGVSIDRIFEFPREQRKRRWRKQYLRDAIQDQPADWVWTEFGPEQSASSFSAAQGLAEAAYVPPTDTEVMNLALTGILNIAGTTYPNANAYCRALGYQRVIKVDPYLAANYWQTNRQDGGTWYVKVRQKIHFRNGADCVRRVRR